jgi:type II secretory pathway component GspD/PulD (secretin)
MYKANKPYRRISTTAAILLLLYSGAVGLCAEQALIQDDQTVPATVRARLRTPVTYSCTNSPIDTVLSDLAKQADIYIVKSPDVTGAVTVEVVNVPFEEVLTNVLAAHKYTYVATENMIRVVPLSETVTLREELITRVYKITYASSMEVALALKEFLSANGRVAVNKGTSHLIVTDTSDRIKGIDNFIREIDRATDQVLVEVRIYDITSDERFKIETAWDISRNAPEIITQHTNTSSTRSGYDFDTLLPHLKDILPQETKTETGDIKTTTTPGAITTTKHPSTVTTTQHVEGTPSDQVTTTTGDDNLTETIDRAEDVTTVETGEIWEEVATGPTIEEIETGDITNTTRLLGLDGTSSLQDLMNEYMDSTVNRSTTTKSYMTRRRKPVIGGSFSPTTGGTLRLSLLNDAIDLDLALSLLHSQVEAKLLANPRILVLDNETANFEIVREIPYRELQQVARADPITYTAFKNVGVQLKVTPHIARDGMIKLHIAPEFGVLVGLDALGLPTVDTRRADTTTLIEDGQTVVLGGLRRKEHSKGVDKVPLLGDMPLIGGLFRGESETEQTKELVLFITTSIITKPMLTQAEQMRLDEIDRLVRNSIMAKPKRKNQANIEPKQPKPSAPATPPPTEAKAVPNNEPKPENQSANSAPINTEDYIGQWMNKAQAENGRK